VNQPLVAERRLECGMSIQLAPDPVIELWRSFGDAIGQAKLREAYGSYWPRHPVAGELVWRFTEFGHEVAWSAARRDPVEPIAWLMLGVWPAFQRYGWADAIRAWTAAAAFANWPAIDAVGVAILHSNPTHLARWASKDDWRFVGALEYPRPGESIFIRERGA
jgi:hypothetical protein